MQELRRSISNTLDPHRMVVDPEEGDPNATILYIDSEEGEIVGTLRIRRWEPGQIPESIRHSFCTDDLPEIEKLTVAEMGRLVLSPGARRALPSLLKAAYFRLAMQGTDLLFCRSASGQARQYRKIGFRPYTSQTLQTADGLRVPLLMVLSDEAFLYRTGSFLAPMAGRFFGPGLRGPLDTRDSGTRSATVRALSECRVLVLRRGFLDQLMEKEPEMATAVIVELSHVLAERLAARRSEAVSAARRSAQRGDQGR